MLLIQRFQFLLDHLFFRFDLTFFLVSEERFFFEDVLSLISLDLFLLEHLLDLFGDLGFMERHKGFDLRLRGQSDGSYLVDLLELVDRGFTAIICCVFEYNLVHLLTFLA